jgi:glycosyltransferase involved in cell wall biosynthesis
MHVLITANAAWNLWNFRRPIIEALVRDGCTVTILAPEDDCIEDLRRIGCKFLALTMNVKGLNPLEDLRLVRRFSQVFEREKPNVVLSFTIKNNIFGAMGARSLGIPFIPTVTGLGTAFLSGGVLQIVAELLYRRAFKKLPAVFFQNEDDRTLFTDRRLVDGDQARVLPGSGIDLGRFLPADMPPSDEPPVFLLIARLLRDKGVIEFVQAARQVKAGYPAARFQLLGAAQSENRTAIDAATVQGWVDGGIVEHLGTTPDVRPFIAASSCVVLPSYREGAPRTLIEAAAMARPLIATDVPGCRAVIDREISGFLCDVRDADSLAAAIRRFLSLSGDERSAMGKAGRAKMEREFDEAIVVDAYRGAIASFAP